MKGYTVYTSYDIRNKDVEPKHWIELWTQPLHRWLIAQAYHRYDDIMWRLPGFRWVENQLLKASGDKPDLPWGAKMDCRCYELMHQGRVVNGRVLLAKDVADFLAPGSAPS